MTQEEKQLLLKDLCARLLYGVKFSWENKIFTLLGIVGYTVYTKETHQYFLLDDIKPYLRPMSSMTEEELNECVKQSGIRNVKCPNWYDLPKEKHFEARLNHSINMFIVDSRTIDWLNAHHFDYRGLISMGLALEAPEGMYKF